jgi:DNA-binding transcriptional ArsR family regulator
MSLNEVFRALGDPTRREIVRLLRAGDMTAGELAERFPLAPSTLSGHFNVLKHAGLIVVERQGTRLVYSLNVSAAEEALGAFMDMVREGPAPDDSKR